MFDRPQLDRSRPFSMRPRSSRELITSYRPATLFWMALVTMLSVPVVTLGDITISRWFVNDPLPRELGEAFDLTRVFSHGSGVLLILLGIVLLSPRRRWHVPRLAALALGGGAVATIVKMFVLRPRPSGLNLELATYESAWLWAFDWNLGQVITFDAGTRSFPSGNMATAMGLTVGLWIVFPRGRMLFAAVCWGTLMQSLNRGTHFLSDMVGGAGIGLFWSYVCYHPHMLGNLFDKLGSEPPAPQRRPTLSIPRTARVRADTAASPLAKTGNESHRAA